MLHGPLVPKIVLFTIPLILTGLLQCAFSAADSIVVGHFAGSNALAAVGATSQPVNILLNVFMGLSVGTTVAMAQSIGAGDEKGASEYAHCSIGLALLIGCIIAVFACMFARPVLIAMNTPENVLDDAVLYFRIYIASAPAFLLYNYGAAILRTVGDTARPFIFLSISGVVNVILNLILVIIFDMSVAGVAIATFISNFISAILVFTALLKSHNESCKIEIAKIRLYPKKVLKVLYFGAPIAFQSSLFSVSNLLFQSTINSFGEDAVAGNAAAISLESFLGQVINGFATCILTFTSQNYGAKNAKRIKDIGIKTHIIAAVFTLAAILILYIPRKFLLGLYITDSPEAIECALSRMKYNIVLYHIGLVQSLGTSYLRGMGKAIMPMLYSIFFICVVRIIWLFTIFPLYNTLESLYVCYPITWGLLGVVNTVSEVITYKKSKKAFAAETQAA